MDDNRSESFFLIATTPRSALLSTRFSPGNKLTASARIRRFDKAVLVVQWPKLPATVRDERREETDHERIERKYTPTSDERKHSCTSHNDH
jgi:hypothetical protein